MSLKKYPDYLEHGIKMKKGKYNLLNDVKRKPGNNNLYAMPASYRSSVLFIFTLLASHGLFKYRY
jgi:hypothetical protein